ncbi:RNA dependent RNA polymerase-domain-containing protein [Bisporella sp. PMI_857]|nr:RNA dependent RNA polymerase-domain-containing protein [Bisporella sp. PMI_857]
MGRMWSVFCSKKLDQIEVRKGIDQTFTNRIFFFATDGNEFQKSTGTPKESQGVSSRSAWTVEGLLNWIRPTWENKHQPALKLYARTELAVSRNMSTVVLNNSQIRQKRDLYWPRNAPEGQCMTDGGGRMSQSLALKITQKLGLSYLPCAFQGRLGGAKGLWVIDISDLGTEDWIEVYGEQLKWVRNGNIDDRDYNDPAHRTFEVVKYSGPHGPSSLNLQLLPILVNGALDKLAMRDTISGLLRDSLVKKMKEERAAMDDAQVFRKWIRDSSNPVADRVKNGVVPYKAAMPVALGEKINMFLDAGFEPLKLDYLQTLARQAYEQHCKDLEDKMHIPVERSTYAFMAPDWTETLEEGEVFFHPSECFVDELSLSAGLPLQGDILVARLPAHFPSDIQKVKAVVRTELMGLKDVVVFSTKGSCLADKLSGGDYDGDQAWICWEPTLVGNFKNSKVPDQPNLVEEGLIIKDSTTFESLVRNEKDPTQKFLNYSLEFALEQRMVGICTTYKEKWTYTHKTIKSRDAVRLSKLLSDLVDQAKQGYKFTEKEFEAFKGKLADSSFRMPIYMTKAGGNKVISGDGETHIIDHLTYVAHETIQKSLEEFHNSFPQIQNKVDEDLTAFHKHVMEEAAVSDEWLPIMKKLMSDLEEAKERWRVNNDHKCEDDKPEFGPILEGSYDHYLNIQPDQDTPLTKVLLGPWIGHADFTQWALLRASTLVASYYSRGYKLPKFVWWMAGKQLCHLKSLRNGGAVTIAPHMYAMLRPDNTFVKLRSSEAAMELALGELEEEDELAAGSGVDVMMLTSTMNGSSF